MGYLFESEVYWGGGEFRWTCHRRGEPHKKRLGATALDAFISNKDVLCFYVPFPSERNMTAKDINTPSEEYF